MQRHIQHCFIILVLVNIDSIREQRIIYNHEFAKWNFLGMLLNLEYLVEFVDGAAE